MIHFLKKITYDTKLHYFQKDLYDGIVRRARDIIMRGGIYE
jgi:hypothetical protein